MCVRCLTRRVFAIAILLSATAVNSARAQRIRVGETYPFALDSRMGVSASRPAEGRVYTIRHPGASYIAVHFASFDLAPGDYVVISDADGGQRYTLEGRGKKGLGTFWARHVKGDTLVLDVVSSGAAGTADAMTGLVVDEYAAGYPAPAPSTVLSVCGSDDKLNAVCYKNDPEFGDYYDKARAVVRLLIGGTWGCTGWLASPDGHVITNHHCISTETEASITDFDFLAEAQACDDTNCEQGRACPGTIYSGSTLIRASATLDYALLKIDPQGPSVPPPAELFGWLEIDKDWVPNVGEQIYIPQHPGLRGKELAVESDYPPNGGLCKIDYVGPGACSNGAQNHVGYHCDTEAGSSGSPVIAASTHKVIALHHCAGCPNRGVAASLICADMCGPPGCWNPDACDDGNVCTVDDCDSGDCVHTPATCGPAEGCCPPGCVGLDPDCCLTSDECDDDNDCTTDVCPANGICVNTPWDCVGGDGCCPPGCSPGFDADCQCVLEPDELPRGEMGGLSCDDGDACTVDDCGDDGFCSHDPITACTSDDQCCPSGCSPCSGLQPEAGRTTGESGEPLALSDVIPCDADCCVVTADCNDGDACTTDTCNGGICSRVPVTYCGGADGCCPAGCGACDDPESGCDPDCCVTHGDCVDSAACTTDVCVSGTCAHYTISSCGPADGCCPAGCGLGSDPDCCLPGGARCTSNAQCCAGRCTGSPKKTCQWGPVE